MSHEGLMYSIFVQDPLHSAHLRSIALARNTHVILVVVPKRVLPMRWGSQSTKALPGSALAAWSPAHHAVLLSSTGSSVRGSSLSRGLANLSQFQPSQTSSKKAPLLSSTEQPQE